jgi:hypothetical protein
MDWGNVIAGAYLGAVIVPSVMLLARLLWPTANAAAAKRRQAWAIGIGAGLAGGLIATLGTFGLDDYVDRVLRLKSPLELVAKSESRRLMAHPRFQEVVKGKSAVEARAFGSKLANDGLQFLDLPRLDRWSAIRLDVAERSQPLCAQMWKGGIDPELLMDTLGQLPEDEIHEWVKISVDGSIRALDQVVPEPVDPSALPEGLSRIVNSLPADEAAVVKHEMASPQSLSDDRACKLLILVFERAPQLPDTIRRDFYRGIAKG